MSININRQADFTAAALRGLSVPTMTHGHNPKQVATTALKIGHMLEGMFGSIGEHATPRLAKFVMAALGGVLSGVAFANSSFDEGNVCKQAYQLGVDAENGMRMAEQQILQQQAQQQQYPQHAPQPAPQPQPVYTQQPQAHQPMGNAVYNPLAQPGAPAPLQVPQAAPAPQQGAPAPQQVPQYAAPVMVPQMPQVPTAAPQATMGTVPTMQPQVPGAAPAFASKTVRMEPRAEGQPAATAQLVEPEPEAEGPRTSDWTTGMNPPDPSDVIAAFWRKRLPSPDQLPFRPEPRDNQKARALTMYRTTTIQQYQADYPEWAKEFEQETGLSRTMAKIG